MWHHNIPTPKRFPIFVTDYEFKMKYFCVIELENQRARLSNKIQSFPSHSFYQIFKFSHPKEIKSLDGIEKWFMVNLKLLLF